MPAPFSTSAYRYPNEQLILAGTLVLVFAVIALSAAATLCTSVILVSVVVGLAYLTSQSHHHALMRSAYPVSGQRTAQLAALTSQCTARLQPGPVEFYLVPNRALNAYTFGLSDPKVVVIYASLLKIMDADELRFIIGHELGHVRLGHTWLNSLVGGMAGIPSSGGASALLTLALLSWNRACEYSADRAGLLACGSLEKATTALIKLVAGPKALTQSGLQQAYQQIDAEDDSPWGSLNEALGTHPMIIRRIQHLRQYAQTDQYHRLQVQLAQNG